MTAAVLITGVSQRIGLHLARTFLERGIPVIGTYRTERPALDELRTAGAELHACDFYRDTQLDDLIAAVTGRHDRLRAIIHNASDWMPETPETPPAVTMRQMMEVHVTAPYRLNLALAALLQGQPDQPADIIHIGDYVSSCGSTRHIAYAASKAAQDNLTLSFARLLAPDVKVNSVAPALVMFNEDDDPAYREKARSKNLMGREGGLEEFQRTIDYLMAGRYTTGRILPFDGGRHLV